jgi:hypothetical protein
MSQDEKRHYAVLGITCRMIGPGGTDVDFYPTKQGLKAIWTNENCPYVSKAYPNSPAITADEETREASDGHNVSNISWDTLNAVLQYAIKEGLYTPQ